MIEVGKWGGGFEGQYTIADNAAWLEQRESVVAPDAADAKTIETVVAEWVPESVGQAIDIRPVQQCAITDGEGRFHLTLVLVVETTREIEEGTEILVAGGAAFVSEEEGVPAVIGAVQRRVLILHGMDNDPVLVGVAIGNGESIEADFLRVEPKGAVASAADLPDANDTVGICLVDGEDGGGSVGAETVGDDGQGSVGQVGRRVEIGDPSKGCIAGRVGCHKSNPWQVSGLPPCYGTGKQETGKDEFV